MDQVLSRFTEGVKTHGLPLAIFLVTCLAFFAPQLQGKLLRQSDTKHSYKINKESWDYYAATGNRNLWSNGQFSGMPTYQTGGMAKSNVFLYLQKFGELYIKKPIGMFLFGLIACYIMFILMGVNRWLSTIGALSFCLSTSMMGLVMAGHNSKIYALMTFPLILAGVHLLMDKRLWAGVISLVIGLGLHFHAAHYQMSLYVAMMLGLYVIIRGIGLIRSGQAAQFSKSLAIPIIIALITLGTGATKLLTTMEYMPDTIRGEKIVQTTAEQQAGESSGLGWNYATHFSYNLQDLASLIYPRFAGGSHQEEIALDSKIAKAIINSSYQPKINKVALYYGGQPFTEGPPYIGITVFLLFLMGLFLVDKTWVIWSLVCIGFAAMYSLGDHFAAVNKFLFETIPLFDRFRAPASILAPAALCFPVIFCLGLDRLMRMGLSDRKAFAKKVLYIGGALAAVTVLLLFLAPSIMDMSHSKDSKYTSAGVPLDILLDTRANYFRMDMLRALAYIAILTAVIWAWLKNAIGNLTAVLAILALVMIDLAQIDWRIVSHDKYTVKASAVRKFEPTAADRQILQDKDIHYRVIDNTSNAFRSSDASYFHKSIGGYSAVKLRRYEDLINYHMSKNNMKVLSMLNAKYGINGPAGNPTVTTNSNVCGNAWFVREFLQAQDNKQELTSLSRFEPRTQAVVHQEYLPYIQGINPDPNGTISLRSYDPVHMIYDANTARENFAVFSEIWYGPNKGWQAYIDGQAVEHIRVNYALRGLKVPAGQHVIEFKFDPKTYRQGELISKICSLLCLLAIGFCVYRLIKTRSGTDEPSDDIAFSFSPEPEASRVKKKSSTSSKKKIRSRSTSTKKKTNK